MGGLAVHDGIFKSNLTAGKRRNKAKALGAKSDVGNALLGMMPFVITEGQSGSWERGIPPQIIMKRRH